MKSITKFGALLAAIVCIGSTAAMQPAQASDYHFNRHESPRFEHREWRNNFRNDRVCYTANRGVVNGILCRLGL
ncbi:MAG TPA: hypothetical protein V6C69_03380 [Trichormus sp.]|jgi:hypothetical protein